ncbi:cytochrome o ubiquinol oxidase subunit III [Mangrovibacterium diazotrophicum]|uniref:Cytochrome bo(3) ubiquinol oxidase subunit 3 n=1 Tax=Mangrovibacterium diazotrophicum TaxID=1261403 RepID=A0A419WA85_9BACT|nr:cytochrome o ubiquinol oxidase subunit III [Mangrovibacterium diazotrophicum]RKD92385.1 cytochrome bo3 quinol oxidase subunit 3 [Mangrovibacterium diazotrophicum]
MSTVTKTTNIAHDHDHGHHDQTEIKTFGFWVYLMTDLILFSTFFATFAVIGKNYAGGPGAKELFELPFLFIETMLLLVSSVTFGFAMIAMKQGKKQQMLSLLVVTGLLGAGFLGMELYEFAHMIGEGAGPDRSGFLSAFFTLVGFHGLHVTFGIVWLTVMFIQIVKMGFTTGVKSRLERLSLFWHFLDIVWVGVFTFVYLFGLL